MRTPAAWSPLILLLCCFGHCHAQPAATLRDSPPAGVYPAARWEQREPEQLGLDLPTLKSLAQTVGGRGCVVRHGYMAFSWGDQTQSADIASAFKPLLSTLLLLAVQEGRITSVDQPVATFEPRLRALNQSKDAAISWRHLASQMSGYGLLEKPGDAYAYNDYAITLYFDTLMQKVFQTHPNDVLKTRLAGPLQFEDRFTFEAFGPNNRPGRLALSVRDFARFGLLWLRTGRWGDRQLLRPDLCALALSSIVPPATPLTEGREAPMLPSQRSMGGGKNITPVGPGFYSFNWWLNLTNAAGQHLFPDAPPDAFVASGHGGKRALWIFPSLDLIVSYNDSPIEDHDQSPGNSATRCNQAARLMAQAVAQPIVPAVSGTRLERQGTRFTLNGQPTFLLGLSYYGALSASSDTLRADLDDLQKNRFNWIRVWANWAAFQTNVGAVSEAGHPRQPFLDQLRLLIAECDRRGLIVDVTLSRGNGVTGPARLQTLEEHQRAVHTLVTTLQPWRNWYLDLANERNIQDKRFASFDDLKALRPLVRQIDPARLVTASHAGDLSRRDVERYLQHVQLDLLAPHRPRQRGSPGETQRKTAEALAWSQELNHPVPLHHQEPFRRGYGSWEPSAEDFLQDLRGALAGAAAGWCLHNGDQRNHPDGQPRRSFDLRHARLFDQLDDVEKAALRQLAALLDPPRP